MSNAAQEAESKTVKEIDAADTASELQNEKGDLDV